MEEKTVFSIIFMTVIFGPIIYETGDAYAFVFAALISALFAYLMGCFDRGRADE